MTINVVLIIGIKHPRNSDFCHPIKHSNQILYGLLQPLPNPETRASRFNIPYITQLPAIARDGYDCIITIVNPQPIRGQ